MIKTKYSKANLFLIELMINIVFFFILVSLCLLFFVKTEVLSQKNADLQFATYNSENIAAVYKSGDGTFNILEAIYPQSMVEGETWTLYFDKDQQVCTREEAYYSLNMVRQSKSTDSLAKMLMMCKDYSGAILYQIDVYHYTSLHPKEVKGGVHNE